MVTMTMDPTGGAPRRLRLVPAIAEVGGRRLGRWVGRGFAKPLANILRGYFNEDALRVATGDVTNPLLALGIDAAWVLISEMNPGSVMNEHGEERTIDDEAWEGFILELQQALREGNPDMPRRTPPAAGGAVPPPPAPPPPPKPHPIGEAIIKVAVDLITDEKKLRRTAKRINAQAEVTRDEARGLEAVNNKRTTFWDWLVQGWRDLMSIFN